MQTIDIAQAIKDNSANVSQNLDSSVLEGLILKFNSNGYYKTIFKVVDSQNGSWDDYYDCLFVLYRVNVPGSNPYDIIGGNQSVILNVNMGPQYCGQYAFGFSSNKIAFRNRNGRTTWTSWKLV